MNGAAARIVDSFGLARHRTAHLIGGGGKTSLMFALARMLVLEGKSVITTTSTKILYPEAAESACVLVGPWESLRDQVKDRIGATRHITVARSVLETERKKLCGYPAEELGAVVDSSAADYLLVEADGAAGRSIKAHRDHEPVFAEQGGLVIAVIGIDCLGKPMNAQHVQRAELFCQRLNRPLNSTVTVDDVSAIVFHPEGYLKKVRADAQAVVFISKVVAPEAKRQAALLVEALKKWDRAGRIDGIVVGDVRGGQICLC